MVVITKFAKINNIGLQKMYKYFYTVNNWDIFATMFIILFIVRYNILQYLVYTHRVVIKLLRDPAITLYCIIYTPAFLRACKIFVARK